MKTALFDFQLPESLIATHPAEPRDSARLLVVREALQDAIVSELPDFLKPGDVMVFNNTKVIPARLFAQRGEAKIELLLHKQCTGQAAGVWQCFAKPAKKLRPGDSLTIAPDFTAQVLEKQGDGQVVIALGENWREKLERYGHVPLPPYIERGDGAADKQDYQTVYAKHEGSVAAPTAGLHFTPRLLSAIDAVGARRVEVTLHVGGGTFLPVKAEDTKDHTMHSEWAQVSAQAASAINEARARGGRVIAVGTTSMRTLESAAAQDGTLKAYDAETNIFITPGYRFKIVDMLLTNFHLPKSTLFMLVSAFSGRERMLAAYQHAIMQRYRFYSYGDACLLYRAAPSRSAESITAL
ncbi:MAG: tRNA preQ1(34) S-adenosylmethionine ribosyltransferase-isomerase QueA [Alphaproteobacteria bacterium]|nr:tRNA preQ1(34) S-adenosylmethionine ribosyltransferase-isomerase QueA [Alphaproteobacteria bacterium]